MTAINHALTGALIGFSVANPVLAIVLAFVSHFVLDALPHYDYGASRSKKGVISTFFKRLLIIDGLLCISLVAFLAIKHPVHWQLAAVCAFIATSPDLMHLNHFYRAHRSEPWKPNLYNRFASKIQWFERPIGAFVEVAWAACMLVGLSIFV